MDIQTMRNFLNMQLDAAEKAENSTEAGALMFLMADYLLESVEKEPEIFTEAEEAKLRRIFLRIGSAGERLKNIHETYQSPLEESAAKILQKIKANMEMILKKQQELEVYDNKVQELEVSVENQKALLEQETELKRKQAEFDALLQKIESCKTILETLTPELIAEKQQEFDSLDEKVKTLTSSKEEVEKRILSATEEIKVLDGTLKQRNDEEKDLKKAKEELEKRIKDLETQLEEIEGYNRTCMEKAETLSNAIVKAGETMEELREELKENERLQEAVHKNGLFKPEEFAERLDVFKKQGDQLLKEYATAIGDVLEDAKALYEKIQKRHHL